VIDIDVVSECRHVDELETADTDILAAAVECLGGSQDNGA
jgi:hypothetical protein